MKVKFLGFSTILAQNAMSRWVKELCPAAECVMIASPTTGAPTLSVRKDDGTLVDCLVGTASKSAIESFLKVTKAI